MAVNVTSFRFFTSPWVRARSLLFRRHKHKSKLNCSASLRNFLLCPYKWNIYYVLQHPVRGLWPQNVSISFCYYNTGSSSPFICKNTIFADYQQEKNSEYIIDQYSKNHNKIFFFIKMVISIGRNSPPGICPDGIDGWNTLPEQNLMK